MLRILLHECFGLFVGSKYDESTDDPSLLRIKDAIGYGASHRNNGLVLTKTHDLPSDDSPAIYMVRNGLAAVTSYAHFLRTFAQPVEINDIIAGNVMFGGWSDHVRGWNPRARQNTLLLRYEDVCRAPETAVRLIGDFLGREPISGPASDFGRLQAIDSRFFRSGSNERNIAELTADQRGAFMELHGSAMLAMGYAEKTP